MQPLLHGSEYSTVIMLFWISAPIRLWSEHCLEIARIPQHFWPVFLSKLLTSRFAASHLSLPHFSLSNASFAAVEFDCNDAIHTSSLLFCSTEIAARF